MNISIIGKDCCGCRSCEQSCPKKCISMRENTEGFIYPIINSEMCVECGACLKRCPIYNYSNNLNNPVVYALKNKSRNILQSASGGACDIVSRKIIKQGGVVYGVAYDDAFNANHVRVTQESDLLKLQSSKYVFSDTNTSFSSIKNDLELKKQVLFIGSSCQVDGLLCFLGKKYDNLFTISIICHGMPSPILFKKYLKFKQKQIGSKILSYDFRSKDKNGWGLTEKITCENGKKYYEDLNFTSYGHDFLKGYSYRENCYKCKYCNTNRVGDWSVGDFWGIESCHPEFYDSNGVSVIIVTSDNGMKMKELIANEVSIIDSTIENAKIKQGNLISPTKRPEQRDNYYIHFNNDDCFFENRRPKKNIKYYLKKFLPKWFKRTLKKIIKK